MSDNKKVTKEEGTAIKGSKPMIFNSQDFMEFLSKQGDIAKLTVETVHGDRINASFTHHKETAAPDPSGSSLFKSVESLQSVENINDPEKCKQPFVSLEFSKLLPPASSTSTTNPRASSYPWPPPGHPPSTGMYAKGYPTHGSFVTANPPPNPFTSREWQVNYAAKHVDVTYNRCFSTDPLLKNGPKPPHALPSSVPPHIQPSRSLPPKKQNGQTDWNGIYESALSPLVEAASRAHPINGSTKKPDITAKKSSKKVPSEISTGNKAAKRKPRKVIPKVKEFVDTYRDTDVLFGRGGRSNHHPGNKTYRELVVAHQPHYRSCEKNEKTVVAQGIVDTVQNNLGRFLELDKFTQRWYIVPNVMARRKVGQALRENNTEEARAAKREKYDYSKSNAEAQQGKVTPAEIVSQQAIMPKVEVVN